MSLFEDLLSRIISGAQALGGTAPVLDAAGTPKTQTGQASGAADVHVKSFEPGALPLPDNAAKEEGGKLEAIRSLLATDPPKQTTLAAVLEALGKALPLPTRAAVDKALRSANHTLHDSTVCTAGAVAMSVDTSGTYTMKLKSDLAATTHYLAAGSMYAMEPLLIKSTGSPGGAKATLYFLT
jgi:hypothetical protein